MDDLLIYFEQIYKLLVCVQKSSQLQTYSSCFVKALAWIWQISQIDSWKFYYFVTFETNTKSGSACGNYALKTYAR